MFFFKEEKMLNSYVSPDLDEKKFNRLVKKNIKTLLLFEFLVFFLFKGIFFMASLFFLFFMVWLVVLFKDTWKEKYKLKYLFYILFSAAPFVLGIALIMQWAVQYFVPKIMSAPFNP